MQRGTTSRAVETCGNGRRCQIMNPQMREAYLEMARQADQWAADAADPNLAELWRRVADNYRELAAISDRPLSAGGQ
jgi:hypothetical protein